MVKGVVFIVWFVYGSGLAVFRTVASHVGLQHLSGTSSSLHQESEQVHFSEC